MIENLDLIVNAMRKKYGDDVIRLASESPKVERFPTGSLIFDWLTGGGFPIGRWCHFFGGYGSAKTLTAWQAIREAQQVGKTAAYYNAENQFDPVWAAANGIDLERLHVVDQTRIEDIGESLESLMSVIDLHVVDSIGAAVSEDELAGDIRDWNPGIAARSWGKALRRANDRFDNKRNTIILINHSKDVFGRAGGEEPGGPKLINFYSSLNMHFRRSSWLFYDKNGILSPDGNKTNSLSGDTEPNGLEFVVRVPKSRISEPFRVARFRMDFQTGEYDHLWVLAKAADYFKVVNKSGSWYTLEDGSKVQGEKGLREAISSDEKLKKAITERVLQDT